MVSPGKVPGFYVGDITNPKQSKRRIQASADWAADGEIPQVVRIASPILDIIPPVGIKVAMMARDGVTEYAAYLGQFFDDGAVDKMTAWIRANLTDEPGHIEVGGEKSVKIYVGSNSGSTSSPGSGKIYIGSDLVEVLSELSDTLGKLSKTCYQLGGTTVAPTISGVSPLTTGPNFISLGVEIDAIKAKIDTLKA